MSTLAFAPCAQPGVQWPRLMHFARPSYSVVATAISEGHQCQPSLFIARAWESGAMHAAGLGLFVVSGVIIFLDIKRVFDRMNSDAD